MSALNMSLYYLFTHSFTLWPDAYECSEADIQKRVYRPVLGTFFLLSGLFFIILYIPCFIVITKKLTRAPVYQLMFALAVFDILSLSVNSICTGVFEILGISFCQYPVLIFCLGAVAGGSWMSGCVACILLAIERCAEVNPHFPFEFLFRKQVFPYVRVVLAVYIVYCYGFVKSIVFSSEYSCWYFDPLIGNPNSSLFQSVPHSIINFSVAIFTTALYIYLAYHLLFRYGYATSMWMYKSKHQILFQAISLCIFHGAAGLIYEYMQFFPSSPTLIIISQVVWQLSSGAVCTAYLVFNRTIRNSVLKMLVPKKLRDKWGIHIGFEEHLAVEEAAATAAAVVNAAGVVVKIDNYFV